MAIHGNYAIVGSSGFFPGDPVTIFERSTSGWEQAAILAANDGFDSGFGGSVAISDSHAAVGVRWDSQVGPSAGAVYVYARSGSDWVQQQKIVPNHQTNYAYFGQSVSLNGVDLLISAPGTNGSTGAVFHYRLVDTNWEEVEAIYASDGDGSDFFGYSVSTDGLRAIIGAAEKDVIGIEDGAAYIYTVDDGLYTETRITAGLPSGFCVPSCELSSDCPSQVCDIEAGYCDCISTPDNNCDGIDDDCDGETDEHFIPIATDCETCPTTGYFICSNGSVTNTCDDIECETDCADEVDNDNDGFFDCEDQDCVGHDACVIGNPCTEDSECGSGFCMSEHDYGYPGGICTRTCDDNDSSSCFSGSICEDGLCYRYCDNLQGIPCESDLHACNRIGDGVTDVCFPVCASYDECENQLCDPAPSQPYSLCRIIIDDSNCDAIDDDNDGETDEDYGIRTIYCGIGACMATGTSICVNGQVQDDCTEGIPLASNDETCDDIDDDCDGTRDEDYLPHEGTRGLGVCETDCLVYCQGGEVIEYCPFPGATPADDDASCNGLDNDCDGQIDEDFLPDVVTCGVGACVATGLSTCVNGHIESDCTPNPPIGNDNTCDGIDDDCDGRTDEHYFMRNESCGWDACIQWAYTQCENGIEVHDCTPLPPPTTVDSTCDSFDDDCDGIRDDDYVPQPTVCGIGACAATGTLNCVYGRLEDSCLPLDEAAEVDDSCNGIDNDCDGQTDEHYVPVPFSCELPNDCIAQGSTDCVDGVLVDNCNCIGEQDCTDQIDIDADGLTDCADDDCRGTAPCEVFEPPATGDVAPENVAAVPTSVYNSSSYLITGLNPIQRFVHAGTIDPKRAAVIKGRVFNPDGTPLVGVRISVIDHPEFGETASASNGSFAILVNGGGSLALAYTKVGYVPLQRKVKTRWGWYEFVDDVVMTQYDSGITAIDLAGSNVMEVAFGTEISDEDGTRQAVVLFPAAVEASMLTQESTYEPLPSISLRITELSVGSMGNKAIPAELPSNMGYGYAIELTAEEALLAGAKKIVFSEPVIVYVDDFMNVPTGTAVPLGYYSREASAWLSLQNGRVVAILEENGGVATLDINGEGIAATQEELDALGVSDDELAKLAELYEPGKVLWRMPTEHFSGHGASWPTVVSDGALTPAWGGSGEGLGGPSRDEECRTGTGAIACFAQSLRQNIPLPGTPFALHYESENVRTSNAFYVQLTTEIPPSNITTVSLDVNIAGQKIERWFQPSASMQYLIEWDGRDGEGRPVKGTQIAEVKLCYNYDPVQQSVWADYERAFGLNVTPHDGDVSFQGRTGLQWDECVTWEQEVKAQSPVGDFGSWALNIHHTYDPVTKTVYLGDGSRQSASAASQVRTHTGTGYPCGVFRSVACRIYGYECGIELEGVSFEEGTWGTSNNLNPDNRYFMLEPLDIAIGPDGSTYVLDGAWGGFLVRVNPDGRSVRIAGSPKRVGNPEGFSTGYIDLRTIEITGENLPLYIKYDASFFFNRAERIAMDQDGSGVYVQFSGSVDHSAGIERFLPKNEYQVPSSTITDKRGYGDVFVGLEDERATGLAVGSDGSVYFSDSFRVRRVGLDGVVATIAGGEYDENAQNPNQLAIPVYGSSVNILDTVDATSVSFPRVGIEIGAGPGSRTIYDDTPGSISDIAVDGDGNLYIATMQPDDQGSVFVVDTNGKIWLYAGGRVDENDPGALPGEPIKAMINTDRIEVTPDGVLYILERVGVNSRILALKDGKLLPIAGGAVQFYTLEDPDEFDPGPLPNLTGYPGIQFNPGINWEQVFGPGFRLEGSSPMRGLGNISNMALHPNGSLIVTDLDSFKAYALPSLSRMYLLRVVSNDGSEIWEFDNDGKHQRTINALTGATKYSFTYNDDGVLTSVTDGNGNVTTIGRASGGSPDYLVAPFGQRTDFSVNIDGNLTSVHYQGLSNEGYEIDYHPDSAFLHTIEDPKGNTYIANFDDKGRLSSFSDPAGGSNILARTEDDTEQGVEHFVVNKITAELRQTEYEESTNDDGDLLRSMTKPDLTVYEEEHTALQTRVGAHPDGTQEYTVLDPDPRWGMMVPVEKERVVRLPSGLSRVVRKVIEVKSTEDDDQFYLYEFWDGKQSEKTIDDPDTFIEIKVVSAVNDDRPQVSIYTADTRETVTTTPMGRRTTTRADEHGRIVMVQAPGRYPVYTEYDGRGRVSSVTQGEGDNARVTTMNYDPATGYLESETGPIAGVTTSYQRDALGRVLEIRTPDMQVVGFEYDNNSNTTSVQPPGRPAHGFTYTPINLLANYTAPDPSGGGATMTTTRSYNLDADVRTVTLPDGRTVTYNYGIPDGKLLNVAAPHGDYFFSYDPNTGRRDGVLGPDGCSVVYSYDGRLLTERGWGGTGCVNGTVGFVYDNHFRVTSLTINGQAVANYQYDQDGVLTSAGEMSLTIDETTGDLTGTSLGVVSTGQSVDGYGDLSSYSATVQQSGDLYSMEVTERDDAGRIATKLETAQGETYQYGYTYDLSGRLTDVHLDGALESHYDYDANGNRLARTGTNGTETGSYDEQDRLISYGDNNYVFDDAGSLLSKTDTSSGQTTSYEYDVAGGLRQVLLPDGRTIEYEIDGVNRRVGKLVNGSVERRYLYQDSLRIVAELNGSNNVITRFVYADRVNVPAYMIRGGETYRYIVDHLGSVRLVVNVADGTIAQRLDYDEFGRVLVDTSPKFQPFGFAGGLYDPDTGLVRFGARDYDAETGRWTAKDPISFNGGQANLYVYVGNDPINSIDPSGLDDWYAGFDIDLTPFFGGIEYGFGIVWDTDNFWQSGIYSSVGPSRGLSGGIAVGAGWNSQDIEGWGYGVDLNLGVPTPTLTFDTEWNPTGGFFGFGYGAGGSISAQETSTLTLDDMGYFIEDTWDDFVDWWNE